MSNKKGFTAIELMIVVAIIGIIAATILPELTKKQARNRGTLVGPALFSNSVGAPAAAPTSNYNCIEGYVVVGGKQLIDDHGNGVKCNQ